MSRRVVVTGLGVVAPNGIGREAFWRSSLAGTRAVGPITRFDAGRYACGVAGQVDDFDAEAFVPAKVVRQTDRSVHMAMAACELAMADAGLDVNAEDPEEVGMVFSNIFGGMEFAEPELYLRTFCGPERISAYQAIAWFYAAAQGQWSIGKGLLGYAKTLVGDRAGGLQAIGWAAQAIRAGECTVAFAGGFEAPLAPYAFLCHQSSGLLSPRRDPARAYRPFDRDRSGLVLGEGSGMVILETLEHARARGAPIYAEIAGFGSAFGREDDGEALVRASRAALADARMAPADIALVAAEGVATGAADVAESDALGVLFADVDRPPPVTVPKALTGHTLAAAGALDVIWSALMMREGVILPTPGLDDPDPECGIDFVRDVARPARIDAVLCTARGTGGIGTGLVLRQAS